MSNYQQAVFDWVSTQSGFTAFIIFCAGIIFAFQGHRIFQFLVTTSVAAIGWLVGWALALAIDAPPEGVAAVGAATMACLSLWRFRPAVILNCGGTWAIIGHYFAISLGAPPLAAMAVAALAGGAGAMFAHLCYRSMTLLLTVLQGSMLMVIGWVGLSAKFMPTVSQTFVSWSRSCSLLVPILLIMLCVTAYSIQASARRGNMLTGTL